MVKIETTSKIPKAELNRIKKNKVESAASSFSSSVDSEVDVSESRQATHIQATQLFVTLQEMGEKEVAKYHGDKILSLLEEYKMALTMGGVDTQILKQLNDYLESHKVLVKDDRILQVLAEIELRAKLELAKRGLI